MTSARRSIFALAAGPRSKWVVFLVWLVVIFVAAGPANLPGKFADAENNESTSYLPGDAESTKALAATEDLQGGELASAVIVYRRESGLTPADRQKIVADARRLTEKRFPGVVPDGARAAAGGQEVSRDSAPPRGAPSGCAGPTTPIPGQPAGYAPFVGPICSQDGKAAIVTAYLKGNGEGDRIFDPVDAWRNAVSDPGGGLEVKITGAAGYSADAIKVFEDINGTLLLAALTLVIVLLILIYRSPIFLFIPLAAVMFAEILSRSIGYGISELGVTINGQSSSIMSVLVLGAGTDYALLIVARYREELHRTTDRHAAMRAAMRSAGPAVLASAAHRDRGVVLFDAGQGERDVGPRADRGDGRGLRLHLDADSAAGAVDDLRPARLLAVRPPHPGLGRGPADAGERARARVRGRLALEGPAPRDRRVPARRGAAAARAPQRAAAQADPRGDPVAHLRPARPRDLPAV